MLNYFRTCAIFPKIFVDFEVFEEPQIFSGIFITQISLLALANPTIENLYCSYVCA